MPEFMMENARECAETESEFVAGFIEAMFFTSVCSGDSCNSENWFSDETQSAVAEGQADGCLPSDVGYADLHPDSLAAIRTFCVDWQTKAAPLLALAYARDYDESQAGRDLWFTSQGHGVGYWDRTELDADGLGNALSDLARHQEISPFFGDHVEHGDSPFVHVDL